MVYYLDSSIAVKRYALEKGSDWAKSIFTPTADNKVYLGQIGIVEIAAALSKKVRTQELTQENYEAALDLFLAAVENEEYFIASLNEEIVSGAVDLTRRHPLRGYDAVHLATAIALNTTFSEASLPSLAFASSDKILCEAAQKEGLVVSNLNEQ
ncbi:MAG: type II toxin-antitoxin system VapC family toxin [candidate division KSB1 bacterium]